MHRGVTRVWQQGPGLPLPPGVLFADVTAGAAPGSERHPGLEWHRGEVRQHF